MKLDYLNVFWATQAEMQMAIMCSDRKRQPGECTYLYRIIPVASLVPDPDPYCS